MKLTDSSAARVGASAVKVIVSETAAFRQFMCYLSTTISSVISGAIGLVKNGDGTLTLNAANTYTGATTINGGKLIYNNNVTTASSAHSIASGATLELNGSRLNTANTIFSGAGTILKTGAGTTAWGSGAATFALGAGSLIDVQGGTFQGGFGSNEVWTNNLSNLNVASGAIFLGAEASVRVNRITGNGTIQTKFGGSGSIIVGVDNGSSQFDGVIANGPGQTAGVLTKEGTGTITLTGSNTYNGTTNIRNGTIILVGDNRLAAAGAMVLGTTTTSGKLVLGNGTALSQTLVGLTIIGLGGAVVGGASGSLHHPIYSTLTLSIATGTNTFGGKLGGNGTNENNLSLIKSGAGNLTLTAANTYIGGTTINAGRLIASKTTGASTATATFQSAILSVSFNVSPPSGTTNFQFFQGTTTNSYASVTLIGVPVGTTATYTSATSTLAVTVP